MGRQMDLDEECCMSVRDDPALLRLYVIREPATGAMKVGKTTRDPRKRIAEHQTSHPFKLETLAVTCCGDSEAEQDIHRLLAADRLDGGVEWFRPSTDAVELAYELSRRPCLSLNGGMVREISDRFYVRNFRRAAAASEDEGTRYFYDFMADQGESPQREKDFEAAMRDVLAAIRCQHEMDEDLRDSCGATVHGVREAFAAIGADQANFHRRYASSWAAA